MLGILSTWAMIVYVADDGSEALELVAPFREPFVFGVDGYLVKE